MNVRQEPLLSRRSTLFTIWMGLCMAMAVTPVHAVTGQVTLTGTILVSEAGTLLETEQGDFFVLQGIESRPYLDAQVIVTGELGEDELGNDVILVKTIRKEQACPGRTNVLHYCDS